MVRSFSNIPKQEQRVFVAASANDSRRPKSGPNLNGCEDPGRLLLSLDDRSDLVGLKFDGAEPGCFLIVEATAAVAGFFEPAVDGIPADFKNTCGTTRTHELHQNQKIQDRWLMQS